MSKEIPYWEKYTLSIEETAKLFRLGENKIRRLVEENPNARWILRNGNRIQIKKKLFERIIDDLDTI